MAVLRLVIKLWEMLYARHCCLEKRTSLTKVGVRISLHGCDPKLTETGRNSVRPLLTLAITYALLALAGIRQIPKPLPFTLRRETGELIPRRINQRIAGWTSTDLRGGLEGRKGTGTCVSYSRSLLMYIDLLDDSLFSPGKQLWQEYLQEHTEQSGGSPIHVYEKSL